MNVVSGIQSIKQNENQGPLRYYYVWFINKMSTSYCEYIQEKCLELNLVE